MGSWIHMRGSSDRHFGDNKKISMWTMYWLQGIVVNFLQMKMVEFFKLLLYQIAQNLIKNNTYSLS